MESIVMKGKQDPTEKPEKTSSATQTSFFAFEILISWLG
jgi:hypothetical protein